MSDLSFKVTKINQFQNPTQDSVIHLPNWIIVCALSGVNRMDRDGEKTGIPRDGFFGGAKYSKCRLYTRDKKVEQRIAY